MGDKMQSRIKTLAVVVVVLFVLDLAKYFNTAWTFAVDNGCKLAVTLSNLINLSEHLNDGQYQLYIKDLSLITLLFLLVLWRAFFFRRLQN